MEPLKLGSKGRKVVKMQKRLIRLGYQLNTDGDFGAEDETAVKDLQQRYHLPVDGAVDRELLRSLKRWARDHEDDEDDEEDINLAHIKAEPINTLEPRLELPDPVLPQLKKLSVPAAGGTTATPAKESEAQKLAAQQFKTLSEGKAYLQKLQTASLPAKEKSGLISLLKKKVLIDIYNTAYKEEIENLRNTFTTESWLLPEANEAYMHLITDSENFFKDGVSRKGLYYGYTVYKLRNSDRYSLTIHVVRNNMSNLSYSSSLTARKINDKEIEVIISFSKQEGYRWAESAADGLKVTFHADKEAIAVTPLGQMAGYRDTAHGYAAADVFKKVTAKNFSVKNAVKTAIRHLILEYNKALK